MKKIQNIVGINIKKRRKELGMTQEVLSQLTGLTVQAISRIEKSARDPRGSTKELIARALGMSVQDLYSDPNTSSSTPTVESLLNALNELQKEKLSLTEQLAEVSDQLEYMPLLTPDTKELLKVWSVTPKSDRDLFLKILKQDELPRSKSEDQKSNVIKTRAFGDKKKPT